MLKKSQRVDRKTFDLLLKKGKGVYSPLFSLKWVNLGSNWRFSFVVPSSVSKSAVIRNKIKRRGRHIIRKNSELLRKDLVAALFFKKGVEMLSFIEMEKEIISLLNKAKIFK